jgi:hypothetical protein
MAPLPRRLGRLWSASAGVALAGAAGGCNLLTGASDLVVGGGDGGAGGRGASATTSTTGSTGGATATTTVSSSATTTSVSSTAASTSSSTSGSTDPTQLCVDTINKYRATRSLPPLTRWTDEEACVAQEATTDEMQMSAHYSFINMHLCNSSAEDECPGYSTNPLDSGLGLDTCLAQMWAEKDHPYCAGCDTCDFPYENCTNCVFDAPGMTCGHYLNMKSSVLTTVACGFSTVGWYAQDFR